MTDSVVVERPLQGHRHSGAWRMKVKRLAEAMAGQEGDVALARLAALARGWFPRVVELKVQALEVSNVSGHEDQAVFGDGCATA